MIYVQLRIQKYIVEEEEKICVFAICRINTDKRFNIEKIFGNMRKILVMV